MTRLGHRCRTAVIAATAAAAGHCPQHEQPREQVARNDRQVSIGDCWNEKNAGSGHIVFSLLPLKTMWLLHTLLPHHRSPTPTSQTIGETEL